uniref:Uncharacterized protein n=1 Tax=Chromera velia CCMP2878 TaxID=1169474 RepID=A0A0G4G2L1_9ALVE|eukprot:Cvel_19946.t1-p1 / transcript=Cvel_19946.t1 / gene=Cvel_19946 / organism=Chromera_velia_CCMP2878 / gene_product=hypothetical protein / transcript_product=hypothetical protein / location=Cvel_scaffold1755:12858-17063(-) / protein_length=983 / sequence_SO=supercontig / SO=protein_coding / is_pseudo=false
MSSSPSQSEERRLLDYEKKYLSLSKQKENNPRLSQESGKVSYRPALKYLDVAISARARINALQDGDPNFLSDQMVQLLYYRSRLLLKANLFENAREQIENLLHKIRQKFPQKAKVEAGDSSHGPFHVQTGRDDSMGTRSGHKDAGEDMRKQRESRSAFAKKRNALLPSSPLAKRAREEAASRLANVKEKIRQIVRESKGMYARDLEDNKESGGVGGGRAGSSEGEEKKQGASVLLASSLAFLCRESDIVFEKYLSTLTEAEAGKGEEDSLKETRDIVRTLKELRKEEKDRWALGKKTEGGVKGLPWAGRLSDPVCVPPFWHHNFEASVWKAPPLQESVVFPLPSLGVRGGGAAPLENLEIRKEADAFLSSLCPPEEPPWEVSVTGESVWRVLPCGVIERDETLPCQERVLKARGEYEKKRGGPLSLSERVDKFERLREASAERWKELDEKRKKPWEECLRVISVDLETAERHFKVNGDSREALEDVLSRWKVGPSFGEVEEKYFFVDYEKVLEELHKQALKGFFKPKEDANFPSSPPVFFPRDASISSDQERHNQSTHSSFPGEWDDLLPLFEENKKEKERDNFDSSSPKTERDPDLSDQEDDNSSDQTSGDSESSEVYWSVEELIGLVKNIQSDRQEKIAYYSRRRSSTFPVSQPSHRLSETPRLPSRPRETTEGEKGNPNTGPSGVCIQHSSLIISQTTAATRQGPLMDSLSLSLSLSVSVSQNVSYVLPAVGSESVVIEEGKAEVQGDGDGEGGGSFVGLSVLKEKTAKIGGEGENDSSTLPKEGTANAQTGGEGASTAVLKNTVAADSHESPRVDSVVCLPSFLTERLLLFEKDEQIRMQRERVERDRKLKKEEKEAFVVAGRDLILVMRVSPLFSADGKTTADTRSSCPPDDREGLMKSETEPFPAEEGCPSLTHLPPLTRTSSGFLVVSGQSFDLVEERMRTRDEEGQKRGAIRTDRKVERRGEAPEERGGSCCDDN